MERLQAALEQARTKREQSMSAGGTPGTPAIRTARTGIAEAWEEILPMEVSPKRATRSRLTAIGGGSAAAPYDILRTKVLKLCQSNGWNRIAITSPAPGSGKTTTSVNLSISLARQSDLRITLMDLDMRRPAMAKTLGVRGKGRTGFSKVLEGEEPFGSQARRIGANLSVSMNYSPTRDPSVLFLRDQTTQVLEEIEQAYAPDFMLFDMPPMMVNDDTSAFLRNVDCAIIIAEAGVSTLEQVDVCEKELSDQTNVLGVVLNKSRFDSDGYGYYYYNYGY